MWLMALPGWAFWTVMVAVLVVAIRLSNWLARRERESGWARDVVSDGRVPIQFERVRAPLQLIAGGRR